MHWLGGEENITSLEYQGSWSKACNQSAASSLDTKGFAERVKFYCVSLGRTGLRMPASQRRRFSQKYYDVLAITQCNKSGSKQSPSQNHIEKPSAQLASNRCHSELGLPGPLHQNPKFPPTRAHANLYAGHWGSWDWTRRTSSLASLLFLTVMPF